MGKGSGSCARVGLKLENPLVTLSNNDQQSTANQLDYSLSVAKGFKTNYWCSKDEKVAYAKVKNGWYITPNSPALKEALREAGLVSEDSAIVIFPTLKETRQAAELCAQDVGIDLDNRLTRQGLIEFQIGSFPLCVYRLKNKSWILAPYRASAKTFPSSLELFFPGGREDFLSRFKSTGLALKDHSTRREAVLAVQAFLLEVQNEPATTQ
jgi:hypothetical protein